MRECCQNRLAQIVHIPGEKSELLDEEILRSCEECRFLSAHVFGKRKTQSHVDPVHTAKLAHTVEDLKQVIRKEPLWPRQSSFLFMFHR